MSVFTSIRYLNPLRPAVHGCLCLFVFFHANFQMTVSHFTVCGCFICVSSRVFLMNANLHGHISVMCEMMRKVKAGN